jgi:hypothetical protein
MPPASAPSGARHCERRSLRREAIRESEPWTLPPHTDRWTRILSHHWTRRSAPKADDPADGRLGDRGQAARTVARALKLIIYFAIDRKFLSPYGTALLICSLRTAKWGHANWSNERAAAIIAVHRSAEGAVLPILHALQEEFGCIPEEAVPLVAVNGASRWRTLADLVDGARAKPFDLTMAGSGTGTFFHVAFEIFKRATKVSMTYVPYSGGAPAVTALLGDHVTSAFTDYPTLAEQLNAGKLRALATKTRGSSLCTTCLPSRKPAMRTMRRITGSAPSRRRRRRGKRFPGSPAGSRRRCTRGRSKHGLWGWGSFRPDNAAPISPRFYADNMTTTAVRSAGRTSKRSRRPRPPFTGESSVKSASGLRRRKVSNLPPAKVISALTKAAPALVGQLPWRSMVAPPPPASSPASRFARI